MGFLSKIFKRKKGGTFVGNLLRGVSSKATGGILGSGAGLRAWEEKQEAKKFEGMQNQIAQLTNQLQSRQTKPDAKAIGGDIVNSMVANGVASKQTDPNVGESVMLETLKKRWYIPTGIVALIGGLAYFLGNRGSKKRR